MWSLHLLLSPSFDFSDSCLSFLFFRLPLLLFLSISPISFFVCYSCISFTQNTQKSNNIQAKVNVCPVSLLSNEATQLYAIAVNHCKVSTLFLNPPLAQSPTVTSARTHKHTRPCCCQCMPIANTKKPLATGRNSTLYFIFASPARFGKCWVIENCFTTERRHKHEKQYLHLLRNVG